MNSVLTPWFPADTKPARPGAYLTRCDTRDQCHLMLEWNGEKWRYADAAESFIQSREWRGLAFDPSTACPYGDRITFRVNP